MRGAGRGWTLSSENTENLGFLALGGTWVIVAGGGRHPCNWEVPEEV